MMRRRSVGLVVLLAATGCLASKSDIQLLQDEFRATRAQLAHGDSSLLRADEARRAQIAQLSAKIDMMNDSLRVLAARVASFQAMANGEFDAIAGQVSQMGERLGQNIKNLQDTRAQLQALREQAAMSVAPPTPATTGTDTSQHAAPAGPGAATIWTTAQQQIRQGAYGSARAGFDQLISLYPTSEYAAPSQLMVAEAYKNLGNPTAADSVYQLVVTKFPGTPEAGTALYRRAKTLWDAGKKAEARPILDRVIKEYANSDAALQARDLLRRP